MEPGIRDDHVLELANRSAAPLLTEDKDFGELVFRLGRVSSGVILIRLAGLSSGRKAEIVSRALREHAARFGHGFAVIAPGIVRVRDRLR